MNFRFLLSTIILSLTFPATAQTLAESQAKAIKKQMTQIEEALELAPYMSKIKDGTLPAEHTAILYTILENTTEAYIHMQGGATGNRVFVHEDGHREAVYDANGNLVQDGVNDGSYNFFRWREEPLMHFTFDIHPWIIFGQSPGDPTTVQSRIYAYMGDLEGGIVRALQSERADAKDWNADGQLQALAIFTRAIERGNAGGLYALFEPDAEITDELLIDVLTKLHDGLQKVYAGQ